MPNGSLLGDCTEPAECAKVYSRRPEEFIEFVTGLTVHRAQVNAVQSIGQLPYTVAWWIHCEYQFEPRTFESNG